MDHPNAITILSNYKNKFEQLITDMENETGKQYQISVQEYLHPLYEKLTIKSFHNRDKYIVENMSEKYTELGGVYNSVEELKLTINKLQFSNCEFDTDQLRWKCPWCGYYETNHIGNYKNSCTHDRCGYLNDSIWDSVGVDIPRGSITISRSRERLSLIESIGSVRFE